MTIHLCRSCGYPARAACDGLLFENKIGKKQSF